MAAYYSENDKFCAQWLHNLIAAGHIPDGDVDDGKARRVKPGVRLLAHGVPARVAKLRAGGNAIVPILAAEMIGAYMDVTA